MVFWFGQSKQTNATESTEQENHESSSSAVSASTTGVGAATTGVANGLFVDESINPMPTNAAPLSNTPNNELSNAPSASTSALASSASATTELTSTTVTTEQTTSTVNPSTTKPPLLSINSVNSSTVNNTTETSSSATATSTDASLSTTTAAVVAKPAPDDSTPFCNAKSNPKKETGWGADALNHDHVKKGYIRLSTDGKSFMCVLCASTIKTRHDYAFSRMSGSGGHEFSDKHRRNVQARELSERHAAKRKAEGKPVQSSILKKQKSLFGLSNFSLTSKKRQKTSETQATTTSTSNSEVANSNGGDEGGKNVSHGESTQFQPDAAGDVDVDLSKAACVPPRDNRNSNNCTGIIPIKRLTTSTPNAPRLEVGTFVRYAAIASDNYGPRYVGENTDMINLFHNNCTGHAIIQTGKRNGGLRCSNCRDYWKKNSSKIAELIRRRASKFSDVLECLLKPSLTDEDAKSMEKFCRTPQDSLSSTGKDLMRQVEDRRNFYNTVCKIPACTEECGSSLAPAAGTLTVVREGGKN